MLNVMFPEFVFRLKNFQQMKKPITLTAISNIIMSVCAITSVFKSRHLNAVCRENFIIAGAAAVEKKCWYAHQLGKIASRKNSFS